MPVSYQQYSVAPTWNGASLLNALETAFVDAGICAAAYDKYNDGTYFHLVVEVVYDASKTYGKRYFRYCWVQGVNRLYYSVANGWNATTHVPTGAIYADWWNNAATASINGFWPLMSLTPATTLFLRRYTSGVNPEFSAFGFLNGTNGGCFFQVPAAATVQPWVDLNKTSFGMLHIPYIYAGSYSSIAFPYNIGLRRDAYTATALKGSTEYSTAVPANHYNYVFTGRENNSFGNNWPYQVLDLPFNNNNLLGNNNAIYLPIDDEVNNPAYAGLKSPVFSGIPYNAYVVDPMPSDFGIVALYNNNGLGQGDDVIVAAGTEEWEIVWRRNNPSLNDSRSSVAFVARIV